MFKLNFAIYSRYCLYLETPNAVGRAKESLKKWLIVKEACGNSYVYETEPSYMGFVMYETRLFTKVENDIVVARSKYQIAHEEGAVGEL